jgi:hypothetical protein
MTFKIFQFILSICGHHFPCYWKWSGNLFQRIVRLISGTSYLTSNQVITESRNMSQNLIFHSLNYSYQLEKRQREVIALRTNTQDLSIIRLSSIWLLLRYSLAFIIYKTFCQSFPDTTWQHHRNINVNIQNNLRHGFNICKCCTK